MLTVGLDCDDGSAIIDYNLESVSQKRVVPWPALPFAILKMTLSSDCGSERPNMAAQWKKKLARSCAARWLKALLRGTWLLQFAPEYHVPREQT
jgi:hypothetical protein